MQVFENVWVCAMFLTVILLQQFIVVSEGYIDFRWVSFNGK